MRVFLYVCLHFVRLSCITNVEKYRNGNRYLSAEEEEVVPLLGRLYIDKTQPKHNKCTEWKIQTNCILILHLKSNFVIKLYLFNVQWVYTQYETGYPGGLPRYNNVFSLIVGSLFIFCCCCPFVDLIQS